MDIGTKIKDARQGRGMTLKQLSEKCGLSVGFLSQLERGLTSVDVESLLNISKILDIPLPSFFDCPAGKDKYMLRSYERKVMNIQDGGIISYDLSAETGDKVMLPRLIELMPRKNAEEVELYRHEGEEFIYVLEGILTVYVESRSYDIFPGDSIHINSELRHNWMNRTNKTVKIIQVNTPNRLSKENQHG